VEAEIIGRQARLTLGREELVLLLSVITALDGALLDDEAYRIQVGLDRGVVWDYAEQFGDLARAIPFEGDAD
jgi:hypothetical protein